MEYMNSHMNLNLPGKCPWCSGPLALWEELKDSNLGVYPKPVAYGRCESCGSLAQLQPLAPQQLGQAYPDSYWIEEGGDSLLRKLALWYQQKVLSLDQGLFLRRVLGTIEGKRILEVGPGRGDFLAWARAHGAKVMGWERSPRAVALLRSKGLLAESVVLEDLSQWPKSEEVLDVIAGFHVLEHLVEPTKVVAALLLRLAPNDLLILQVPRADSWQAKILGRRWVNLDSPRHVTIPSLKGLKRSASRLDLDQRAIKHFSLRDNAFAILASLFPFLVPHRTDFGGSKLVWLLVGTWWLQPLALLEALSRKGGTVMMVFQKKTSPCRVNTGQ